MCDPRGGYHAGDVVRLLLSITNNGTLPIDVSGVTTPGGSRGLKAPKLGGECATPSLAPGAGYECSIEYTVTAQDLAANGARLRFQVNTAQGVTAEFELSIGATEAPVPTTTVSDPTVDGTSASGPRGTLAFTGANTAPQLILALLSIAVGFVSIVTTRRVRKA